MPRLPPWLVLLSLAALAAPAEASPYVASVSLDGPSATGIYFSRTHVDETYTARVSIGVPPAPVRLGVSPFAWSVEPVVDGVIGAPRTTDAFGIVRFDVTWDTIGDHTVQVVIERGTPDEAWSRQIDVVVEGAPHAPVDLVIEQGASRDVAVARWQPPAPDPYRAPAGFVYELYRGSTWVQGGSTGADARSVTFETTPDETYSVRLGSHNAWGWSERVAASYDAPSPPLDSITATIREYRTLPGNAHPEGAAADHHDLQELWMSGVALAQGTPVAGRAVLVEDVFEYVRCEGEYPAQVCPEGPAMLLHASTTATTWSDGSYSATLDVPHPVSADTANATWRLRATTTASVDGVLASASGTWYLVYTDHGPGCTEHCGGTD